MPDTLALKLFFRDTGAFEEGLERQLCRHREEVILWLPKSIRCGRVLVEDPRRIKVADSNCCDNFVRVDCHGQLDWVGVDAFGCTILGKCPLTGR